MANIPPRDEDDLQAVAGRFKVFLDWHCRGNQSVLAKQLGLSQPALSRVIAGEQLPSGRLLLALTTKTPLDPAWLLVGSGTMLRGESGSSGAPTAGGGVQVPVACRPLPGPPAEHPGLLRYLRLRGCIIVPTATQYFLQVSGNDPITNAEYLKVKKDDLILLETSRSLFPEPQEIFEELWVFRCGAGSDIQYRLAEASTLGGNSIEADPFDWEVARARSQTEIVLRPLPDGKFTGHTRYLPREQDKATKRRQKTSTRQLEDLKGWTRFIGFEDLIARKILIVRR
jgi:hypothetical protein